MRSSVSCLILNPNPFFNGSCLPYFILNGLAYLITSFFTICCTGCVGSGKTTLMQRLVSHVQSSKKRGYVLNLDPAVTSLPFTANIDIRDTVNYKNVMKEYHLGPNGGILTSLNLFATKFDEVISL